MANRDLLASLKSEISAIECGNNRSKRSKQAGNLKENAAGCLTNKTASANDESNDAFKKIVMFANVQERSCLQLKEKLSRNGFSDKAVNDAIDRALRCGIVDDARFADVLIRSRISQGKGTSGIEAELKSNGINPDELSGWPYDYATSYDDDFERALTLLEKKPPKAKNKREAAYRKLLQNGFSSSIASDAARAWFEEHKPIA